MAAMNLSLLWVYAALEGGVAVSDLQLNGYDAITLYADQLMRPLYLFALVASIFLFCRFVYCAHRNLHSSNVRGDRMPPGWAVACNFIPIMNLRKPLEAMSQAWRGSFDPERSRMSSTQVIWWWWAFSLISGLSAGVSLRIWIDAGGLGPKLVDFEAFKFSLRLDVLSSIASILSALVLLPVIAAIAKAQDARMENT